MGSVPEESKPEASLPIPFSAEPLNDLGSGTYKGFTGWLYDNSNTMPADHYDAGVQRGNLILPLDTNGNPSPNGKYVLLSIGMSNTSQEFCSSTDYKYCNPWTFTGQAMASPDVNHSDLILANGAENNFSAEIWTHPESAAYFNIGTKVLPYWGVNELQVQAVWLKVANAKPKTSLPDTRSDSYILTRDLGKIARVLKGKYPNVKLLFVSSRIYAGYARTRLNPEPYAYESGISVKWLIRAQIHQMQSGSIDSLAGNLDYNTVAPWIAWGPYLWADGTNPRSDGLVWNPDDFESDGTHPSMSGEEKVGGMLLNFFENSPQTECWFVIGGVCQ